MKIVLFSSNVCSIPACQYLNANHTLQAIICPAETNPYIQQFEQFARGLNVPVSYFSRKELKTGVKDVLNALKPDVVLVFAFNYKIPEELFGIPKFGFFNVHYSLLPRYRGSCPVFWQLKNGDPAGGISIHQVTAGFDAGPILMQKQVQVLPGTSHGIFWAGLSLEAVAVVAAAIEKLENTGNTMLLAQNDADVIAAPAPGQDDLKIHWQTQEVNVIENLVNACSPEFGGAVTMLRNQMLRIFEVTQVELNVPQETAPGTIVFSDPNHGVFVSCLNRRFLRLNVVQSNEGILSGFKLAALGIQAGEQLQSF